MAELFIAFAVAMTFGIMGLLGDIMFYGIYRITGGRMNWKNYKKEIEK